MTITLAPSNPPQPHDPPGSVFRTVTLIHPDDHMAIPDLLENLIIPALVAWGYHPDSVNEYLNPPQP